MNEAKESQAVLLQIGEVISAAQCAYYAWGAGDMGSAHAALGQASVAIGIAAERIRLLRVAELDQK